MFSYKGLFRFEREDQVLRLFLFPDVEQLINLPPSEYSYIQGDLVVSDDGTYVEASGKTYNVWRRDYVWRPASEYKHKRIVAVEADAIEDRSQGWFSFGKKVPHYRPNVKMVEDVSSNRSAVIRWFGLKVVVSGVGLVQHLD